MSVELIIRPEAEADALEAFTWYNEQLPGLGRDLVSELDRTFAAIVEHPEAHVRVHRNMRRALVRRFPYGVFYLVQGDRAIVLAILHMSRDPQLWRRRRESIGRDRK